MKLHPLGTSTSEARYACRRSAILLLLNCPQALVQVVARLPKKAKNQCSFEICLHSGKRGKSHFCRNLVHYVDVE